MDMTSSINDPALAAKAMFPKNYEPITGEFLETYSEPIEILKNIYESSGGIVQLDVADLGGIFRIPTKKMLDDWIKQTKGRSGIDADLYLAAMCVLYPDGQTIRNWVDHGSPGVAGSFARALMEEAKVAVEANRKKL